jgi:glutathione S-transferase
VLKLLGRKTSGNVQKVMVMLAETGLAHTREDYGRQFNNTQTDAYLKLNPHAKVPTLVDGDLVIWESNTILRYLARKSGRFMPGDEAGRTMVERWMDWLLAALNPLYIAVFKDSRLQPAERAASFNDTVKAMGAELKILDGHLAGRSWIAGGAEPTVADFALGPIIHRCLNFGVDLPSLDNVKAWRTRLLARPGFKASVDA